MEYKINDKYFKKVDTKKFEEFVNNSDMSRAYICNKACVNRCEIYNIIKRGIARKVVMNAICGVFNVPYDYFDLNEPVIVEAEPKEEVVEEHSVDHDILVDILITLKKQEGLMLELLNCWKDK